MKRMSPVILAGLFLVVGASVSVADDFRNSTWGDSREAVRAAAGEPARPSNDELVYDVSLKGLNAVLLYTFTDGKLSGAVYFFREPHSNASSYVIDYLALNDLLTEKYGKPQYDKDIWSNTRYEDDPFQWGTALALGHLSKQTIWETERTKISHALLALNDNINHMIQYSSQELESLSEEMEEMEKGKTLDQL